jgi:phosphoenolpyruvate synthase/pyruvate phosphate dikinase
MTGDGRQRAGHGVRQHGRATSATGVAFTRNPSTGEKELYGEFLVNAQGEDVVAGIRTPQDITEKGPHRGRHGPSRRWKA